MTKPDPVSAYGRSVHGASAETGQAAPYLSAIARRRNDPGGLPLIMGIPKKLVTSSPLRNTIRRVIREAYRAACRNVDRGPGRSGSLDKLSVRVRLLRRIDLTTGALKRRIRAEADEAFARIERRHG